MNGTLRPLGYYPRPLHLTLVFSDLLGHILPLMLTPAWLALAAITCWHFVHR